MPLDFVEFRIHIGEVGRDQQWNGGGLRGASDHHLKSTLHHLVVGAVVCQLRASCVTTQSVEDDVRSHVRL